MAPMTDTEVHDFLRSTPPRIPAAATTREDGRPHVAPVWVGFDDDGHVYFNTGADTVKGANLAGNGRVALSFHDEVPPFDFVIIEGTVSLIDDLEQVRHWATRIGGRYMGEDRAEEFVTRNGVPGELLVKVTPTKTLSAKALAD